MKEKIEKIIYEVLDGINSENEEVPGIEMSLDTELYGGNSSLDSLGLVNLIVAIEQNIEDAYDLEITLANERAMSQKRSPFKTVESLVGYIEILLREKLDDK